MKILVDADACPVRNIVVRIAEKYDIPVKMVFDDSHVIEDGYSENVIVQTSSGSADVTLASLVEEDDIIITNDYGLADICIKKYSKVLSFSGQIFSEFNINFYLQMRDMSAKKRRSGKRSYNPKKRKKRDDMKFENALSEMLGTCC